MFLKWWLVWGLAYCLFGCGALFAQSSGSITGTLLDNSGAVVAGADVLVSDPSTGFRRATASNLDGNYLVAGLGAGTYNVTISAPSSAA